VGPSALEAIKTLIEKSLFLLFLDRFAYLFVVDVGGL
jgi:hypothetical protein